MKPEKIPQNLPVENVVDLLSDVSSQAQELSVNAVQHGLQEVALTWIFRVEQIEES